METFSALLALCAGNSPVTGEFPAQRPLTRSFDVFFDLRPNKQLIKQSWGWWFETPSRSSWRHRNDISNSLWPVLKAGNGFFHTPAMDILHMVIHVAFSHYWIPTKNKNMVSYTASTNKPCHHTTAMKLAWLASCFSWNCPLWSEWG